MGAFTSPEIGIPTQPEFFVVERKAELAVKSQNLAAMLNSLATCMFMFDGGGMTLTEHLSVLEAITGWGWGASDFMEAGERIYNLQRLINVRDGKGPEHDTYPVKLLEPATEGARKGQVPPFVELLQELYMLRGWNSEGYAEPGTLDRLGL